MTSSMRRLPQRRSDVGLRDDGQETWLVTGDPTVAHLLNPTARAIWELCDGTTTLEEVVSAICEIFDVPHSTALTDVTNVVDQLVAADLVTWPQLSQPRD
jgi:hypothetical protein